MAKLKKENEASLKTYQQDINRFASCGVRLAKAFAHLHFFFETFARLFEKCIFAVGNFIEKCSF